METFLLVLKYIAGPLIGALIGFFTNWLAVRMLFRPYTEKRIGKLRIPFTPGIIPKRRGALAASVGKAVGESLLTGDDIAAALVSGGAKEATAECAVRLFRTAEGEKVEDVIRGALSPVRTDELIGKARDVLTDRVYSAALGLDLGAVVARESEKAVNEKKQSLGFAAMFLSDDLIKSLTGRLGDGVNAYMESDGRDLIEKAVSDELEKALSSPVPPVSGDAEEVIRAAAGRAFEAVAAGAVGELAKNMDVAGIVERRMNAMDVKELERLVLSVMKKELRAIVNLGGLIGLLLGILTVFI